MQRLQRLFTQEDAAVSKSFDAFGWETITEPRGSIFECETALNRWLHMLVGGALASAGTSAAVPEAGGTSGSNEAGPSK